VSPCLNRRAHCGRARPRPGAPSPIAYRVLRPAGGMAWPRLGVPPRAVSMPARSAAAPTRCA